MRMNCVLRHGCQASLSLLLLCAATAASAQGPQPADQPGQTASEAAGTASPDTSASISPLSSLKSHTADETYTPITGKQRLQWFITQTIGPIHLLGGGTISSAIGTALDRPYEYGSSWGRLRDRFGMRLTGISTGNAMEAGLGAIWGEDPRYFREPDKSFGGRRGQRGQTDVCCAAPRREVCARLRAVHRRTGEQFPFQHLAGA